LKIKSPHIVKPRTHISLAKKSSSETGHFKSEEAAAAILVKHRGQLAGLQEVFYASEKKALLIVLQGMDTAGKDGTISHIFSGINPPRAAMSPHSRCRPPSRLGTTSCGEPTLPSRHEE
jgi:polyphosphate kinase 2 (PPK2 family)